MKWSRVFAGAAVKWLIREAARQTPGAWLRLSNFGSIVLFTVLLHPLTINPILFLVLSLAYFNHLLLEGEELGSL